VLDTISSCYGLRREFHSHSGLEHSPIQLVSPHHYFRDSVEKRVAHQSTSLSSTLFLFQKSIMKSQSIPRMEVSSMACTWKEPNGIQRNCVYVSPMSWSCIVLCQYSTSSQSRSVPSHHKVCTSAHVTTIPRDRAQSHRTPSC